MIDFLVEYGEAAEDAKAERQRIENLRKTIKPAHRYRRR